MRTPYSHTAPFWPSVTMLIQTLMEGECNRVTMMIIWCLLGCEPRSLSLPTFRRNLQHPSSQQNFLYLETMQTQLLPDYTVSNPKLHSTLYSHCRDRPRLSLWPLNSQSSNSVWRKRSKTPQHYVAGKLSVANSGCFISRKKGFSVVNGQYGNGPRAGLSVMQEGRLLSVSGTETRPSSTYLEHSGSRHYDCRNEGGEGDNVTENLPAVLSHTLMGWTYAANPARVQVKCKVLPLCKQWRHIRNAGTAPLLLNIGIT